MKEKENLNCDSETGICSPQPLSEIENKNVTALSEGVEIIYIGDPMCSWCWGISKDLFQLRSYQEDNKGTFKIVVGGLMPGGGTPWDNQFKSYLKHHWEQVNKASGQPFSHKLLEQTSFNYDTEPPCRAVVAARPYLGTKELEFFDAIHEKFYVENEDPKTIEFYEGICKTFDIDFQIFKTRFESDEVKAATREEFVLSRTWGVRGYPSVLAKINDELYRVTRGYATFDAMKHNLEMIKQKALQN